MALTNPNIVKAATECLLAAQPTINRLKQFAFDASQDFYTPGQTVRIPVASVGTLSSFEATTTGNNLEANDGSIVWYDVKLEDPVKATFEINAADYLNMDVGNYMTTFAQASARKIQKYISDKIGGLFDKDDEVLSGNTVTLGTVALSTMAKLRTKCEDAVENTVLMLGSDQYAETLALLDNSVYGITDAIQKGYVQGLFGFAAVVEARDLGTGVKGALIPRNDLVIVSRNFQVAEPACYSEYGTMADPDTGFSVTMLKHGSPATAKAYLNAIALFGCTLINKSDIKLLV